MISVFFDDTKDLTATSFPVTADTISSTTSAICPSSAEEAINVVRQFDLTIHHREALFFVMDYVEKNNYLINCAYDSLGRDQLRSFLYSDFIAVTTELLSRIEEIRSQKLEPSFREYLAKFYAEALAGVLIDWIKHSNDLNREETADYIIRIVRSGLTGIFSCKEPPADI